MNKIKVTRATDCEVDKFEIGDQITIGFDGGDYTATAIKEQNGCVLFLFDNCIEEMPMSKDNTAEGGYEKSSVRAYLKTLENEISPLYKKYMLTDESGDLFRLLSITETCGKNKKFEYVEGQIDWMRNVKHRMATFDGDITNWWLRDLVSSTDFAYVNNYGYAYASHVSDSFGVRPAFTLKHPADVMAGNEVINRLENILRGRQNQLELADEYDKNTKGLIAAIEMLKLINKGDYQCRIATI